MGPTIPGVDPTALDEVRRQHAFIEAWLRDDAVAADGWAHFEASLAEGFSIVGPDGVELTRAALLHGFRSARGRLPGVRVEIRAGRVLHRVGDVVVVRYEEWQHHDESPSARVSTAVMGADPSAPLGWTWLALHETAIVAGRG